MDSDSIPGLTVVLTALSRADLREREDRNGPGAPRCMIEHKKGGDPLTVSDSVGGYRPTDGASHLPDYKHLPQVIEYIMLTFSGTTFL